MGIRTLFRILGGLCAALSVATAAAQPVRVAAADCTPPPAATCTADGCNAANLGETGNAIEPGSGRAFFLDYPCDLQPGEPFTFILSLHGAGSIGNWQRHYFPAVDYKEKYRLVIATPTAASTGTLTPGQPGVRMWIADKDDEYLQRVVTFVFDAFGRTTSSRSGWPATRKVA